LEVIVGGTVNYSSQRIFNGVNTVFTIEKDSMPASANSYSINNGIITFKDTGNYTVTMTNSAIISNENFPAEVIVDIKVNPDPNASVASITNYELQIYPNPTTSQLTINNEQLNYLRL
jgi:hypothetical protein